LCKKIDYNIVFFLRKTPIFGQKLSKIKENCAKKLITTFFFLEKRQFSAKKASKIKENLL
jgi:hypothetical protein